MIMRLVWAASSSKDYLLLTHMHPCSAVLSPNHILTRPPPLCLPFTTHPTAPVCCWMAPPHTGVTYLDRSTHTYLMYGTHASGGEPLPPSVSHGCQQGGPEGTAAGAAGPVALGAGCQAQMPPWL